VYVTAFTFATLSSAKQRGPCSDTNNLIKCFSTLTYSSWAALSFDLRGNRLSLLRIFFLFSNQVPLTLMMCLLCMDQFSLQLDQITDIPIWHGRSTHMNANKKKTVKNKEAAMLNWNGSQLEKTSQKEGSSYAYILVNVWAHLFTVRTRGASGKAQRLRCCNFNGVVLIYVCMCMHASMCMCACMRNEGAWLYVCVCMHVCVYVCA